LVFTHDSEDYDNSHKYILIVDSELDLLNMMQRMFLFHGFKLCVFTDGLAALKHFSLNSKVHPIVIFDVRIGMSDTAGDQFVFVKQVKKINPKVKLILTGDEEQLQPLGTSARVDAFIKKTIFIRDTKKYSSGILSTGNDVIIEQWIAQELSANNMQPIIYSYTTSTRML
jgi:DNA-binding response OmpR family regulator